MQVGVVSRIFGRAWFTLSTTEVEAAAATTTEVTARDDSAEYKQRLEIRNTD